MNESEQIPSPRLSRRFVSHLLALAALWGSVGVLSQIGRPGGIHDFLQLFIFSLLDLIFLILILWKAFFSVAGGLAKKVQILVFITFKLVCLGFLAITLKRLDNASFALIFLGTGFVGIGPLVVGLYFASRRK